MKIKRRVWSLETAGKGGWLYIERGGPLREDNSATKTGER